MSESEQRSGNGLIERLQTRISELETQLQEVTLHNHVLLDIARALNASLDPQVIAANIISAISSLIAIDKASVLLYREKSETFRVIGVFDSSTLSPQLPADFDLSFALKVLHSGKPYYLDTDRLRHSLMAWDWICCLPLHNAQRKIGAINIHAIRQTEISSAQRDFLETVAGHAASALENAILYGIVQQESVTDGLTGIYNHRYFQKRLREYVSLSQRRRAQGPFGLLIIDVDYFKPFNDRYGHPFGDLVLKTVVQTLARNLRQEDVLARYGGEEFVLLTPGTNEKAIQLISEKVRKVVEQTKIFNPATGEELSITVSIGATTWHPSDTPASLLSRADQALYQAKQMGRNLSVFL
ncbi:response regulator PleD [Peptococcaceae bacterium CEB3]|nr:response regulator PleD [Peptococcaceae bacterium CEB3]